jgi:hypothetical protein
MTRKWPEINRHSSNPRLIDQYYPGGWYCEAEPEFGVNWFETKKGNATLKKTLLG